MSQTIDTIFLSHVEKKSEELALTDCAGAERLGLTTINQLTFHQAARHIQHTAAFLRRSKFADGDIVVVQMPNIAETPLILLAILNAGLVPCLIPSHWRRVEIEAALSNINPRAIIAHQSFSAYKAFDCMFEIAAKMGSIRFIFGLGDDLPDGVTPLPDLTKTITSDLSEAEKPEVMLSRSGEQVAFIGWTRELDGKVHPVAYTHIQLMANAHLIGTEIKLDATPSLLSTFAPMNLTGLVASFLPWILEGGSLHIASTLNLASLVSRIKDHDINLALIPQSLKLKLVDALIDAGVSISDFPHLALVSPTPYNSGTDQIAPCPDSTYSFIYNLNGLCLYAQNKANELANGSIHLGPNPVGKNSGPSAEHLNPPFIETRLQGAAQKAGDGGDVLNGRLEISGMAVGFTNWQPIMTTTQLSNFDTHWEKTYLSASITDKAMSLLTIQRQEDAIYHGNLHLCGDELDKLYQAYPRFIDAVAFSLKDPVLGERLFAAIIPQPGDALSYDEFKKYLLDQDISPAKIPEKLVLVDNIPRSNEGLIQRDDIFSPV